MSDFKSMRLMMVKAIKLPGIDTIALRVRPIDEHSGVNNCREKL